MGNLNDTPGNSTQNILPINWKMYILFRGGNLRALGVKMSLLTL